MNTFISFIFKPAENLMTRLQYRQKFSLMGLLFSLTVGATIVFVMYSTVYPVLVFAVLGLYLIFFYLLVGFYRSFLKILDMLSDTTEHMIKVGFLGTLQSISQTTEKLMSAGEKERELLASQDELGMMVTLFNKIATALTTTNKKFVENEAILKAKVLEVEKNKKETLEALENMLATKAKEEAILESTDEGIYGLDLNGLCLFVNNAAAKTLGYTKEEMLGKNIHELIHFKHEDGSPYLEVDCPITRTKDTGVGVRINTDIFFRKDGTYFPVLYSSHPLRENDETVGVVVAFSDITHEKQVDRAKTEFVSLASHQLRTPLTAISWYIEMLLAGDAGVLTKEQKDYLYEVYKGNNRMIELVNALLNVSRIDLGTISMDPVPTDVREIADSLLTELTPQWHLKKMNIIKSYDPALPLVNVDPKLIRIVFQNLLTNAIKYTPEKGTITFSITKDTRNIKIIVADSGYGIPKDSQSRIFGKLYRADNIRDKETDGNGLGLYIVKSIIENSGGKITFKSVENKGTTFTITLPLSGMRKKEGLKDLK
jgi:PAS domain S-box-containing protein